MNEVTSYEYDVLGNLLSVALPDGTIIDYLIDGQNRRIGVTVDGAVQRKFLYNGARLVAELDPDDNVVSHFVYAVRPDVPSYMLKGGQTYLIVTDQQGSVRLVVNVETGDIAQRMDYDPFGQVTVNTNPDFQPFGYAGGLYDHRTGLTRFEARDYDPETGRWTSRDPILFGGDNTSLYTYSLGDPVNLSDPTGRRIQYNGYVFNNPLVLANLELLNREIMRLFCLGDDDFKIYVTGGDRYIDAEGKHRSATNGLWVENSGCVTNSKGQRRCGSSPHLIESGARAVDFGIAGITFEQLQKALKSTAFLEANTKRYNDGHIHIALPATDAFKYTGTDARKHGPVG